MSEPLASHSIVRSKADESMCNEHTWLHVWPSTVHRQALEYGWEKEEVERGIVRVGKLKKVRVGMTRRFCSLVVFMRCFWII